MFISNRARPGRLPQPRCVTRSLSHEHGVRRKMRQRTRAGERAVQRLHPPCLVRMLKTSRSRTKVRSRGASQGGFGECFRATQRVYTL
eukprot:7009809-Prymnesium_polylepis.2